MTENIFILVVSLFLLVKGATLATKYSVHLAKSFHLSRYTVGFIIVAVISVLPETFVSINAALADIPAFGLGTLFGSNVADLTLLFAIIVAYAGRGLKIESQVLKTNIVYPFLLLLPIILGLDGRFTRFEGIALIITGAAFYYFAFRSGHHRTPSENYVPKRGKDLILLLLSMAVLLAGAHYTVVSATELARLIGINPILIAMLIVGLGTTMPELFFSLKSVKSNYDSLAAGDILGTVLADATVVVGILTLINPFSFPIKIIYVTGIFMVAASFLLFYFMRTGRVISKKESVALFVFWVVFVFVETLLNG